MTKVFISYSRLDSHFAMQLKDALQSLQVSGFLDQTDLAANDIFSEKIRDSLRSASALIVLLSPAAIHSNWVMFEVGAAQALGKTIIPVLIPGTTIEDSLPEVLSGFQVLDARNMPIGEIAKKVEAALPSHHK
jgi:TIR domain